MASLPTIKELRSMQDKDLRKEIAEQSLVLAKIQLDVESRSEKDTAKVRRLRRAIARMHTVLREKEHAPGLKKETKSSTVPAPKNP